jgi:hypothetical protein
VDLRDKLISLLQEKGPQHVILKHGKPAINADLVLVLVRQLSLLGWAEVTPREVAEALGDLQRAKKVVVLALPGSRWPAFVRLREQEDPGIQGTNAHDRRASISDDTVTRLWQVLWMRSSYLSANEGIVKALAPIFRAEGLSSVTHSPRAEIMALYSRGHCQRVGRQRSIVMRPPGAPAKMPPPGSYLRDRLTPVPSKDESWIAFLDEILARKEEARQEQREEVAVRRAKATEPRPGQRGAKGRANADIAQLALEIWRFAWAQNEDGRYRGNLPMRARIALRASKVRTAAAIAQLSSKGICAVRYPKYPVLVISFAFIQPPDDDAEALSLLR